MRDREKIKSKILKIFLGIGLFFFVLFLQAEGSKVFAYSCSGSTPYCQAPDGGILEGEWHWDWDDRYGIICTTKRSAYLCSGTDSACSGGLQYYEDSNCTVKKGFQGCCGSSPLGGGGDPSNPLSCEGYLWSCHQANCTIRGALWNVSCDTAGKIKVSGWACDSNDWGRTVPIDIMVNGVKIGSTLANRSPTNPNPDIANLCGGSDAHVFYFTSENAYPGAQRVGAVGVASGTDPDRYLYYHPEGDISKVYCLKDVICSDIDTTPPVCVSSGGSSTWFNTDRTIYGTCSDDGSGCTGDVSKTYTTNTNDNYSPGTVYDRAGNSTVCPTQLVKIDKINPSVSASNASPSWFDEQRTAVVSASDTGGSGLAQVRYRWGNDFNNSSCNSTSGGTVTSNGASLDAPPGGTTLYLCARDNAGNVETWSGIYRWGITAPSVSATNASTTWFNYQRTAVVSASDTGGGGLAQVRYRWGNDFNNNSCNSTSGGTVTSNGASLDAPSGGTKLYLCARNNAGSVGTWSGNYRWEDIKPSIEASNASTTWFDYQRTAVVSASDTGGSGLAQVRYSWGSHDMNWGCTTGGEETSNGASLDAPPGGTILYLCARDNAGNSKTWSGIYRWEDIKPSIEASNASTTWFDYQRTAVVSASDTGGSGLAEIRYYWGSSSDMNWACTTGGTVISNGASLDAPSGGTMLYLCARDKAGNSKAWNGNYRWCTPSIPLNPTNISIRSAIGPSTVWQKILSTDPGNPTRLPRLNSDAVGTMYVPRQTSRPSCTSEYGYRYTGSGGIQEYVHSDYIHIFNPQSGLRTEGATGSVTGSYYTVSMAGTKLYSPLPITGYYEVNNNPVFNCPDIVNTEDESKSPRGCVSTTHTGMEVNNPLKFKVESSDENGNDEIQGAVIWLSKEGKGEEIPKYPGIFPMYTNSSVDHIAVMILKNGNTWDAPLIYAADSTNGNQWGNISSDREIKNDEGERMVTITNPNVTQGSNTVVFELELVFDSNISTGGYPEGNYEISSIVFDEYMFLGDSILDQYNMLKECRDGGWNIDLRKPEFPSDPKTTGGLARRFDLGWSLDGTGSGITNAVINAYSSSTGEDLELLSPELEGQSKTISLSSVPLEENIGHLTDTNSWRITKSPAVSPYTDLIAINIGDNEKGMISLYVTGFDQACNDTLGSDVINLNPWITAKGGLVYSEGSIGVNAKDVEGQWEDLRGMLTRVEPEELDIGTELVSSRNDYIENLIRPLQGAVRAHSVFNSNSRTTWFEYLKEKLELYKGGLIPFEIPVSDPPNTISALCGDEPCYMEIETSGTVNIPKNFICDGKALVMVDGNIHIEPDIVNGSTNIVENLHTGLITYEDKENNIEGCIFIASGDISIGAGDWKTGDKTGYSAIRYDYIEAFMIAGNKIEIEMADEFYPFPPYDRIYMRDGLEIHGGLVAFGKDLPSGESAVQVNRSLALFNNFLPTVVTSWDSRYAKLSEIFFGTNATMYKQEVGFKPF